LDTGSRNTQVIEDQWPKVCACGARWTRGSWEQLALVGRFPTDEPEIEMRTCTCRSTIAVALEPTS
jgi:hypothetical protein